MPFTMFIRFVFLFISIEILCKNGAYLNVKKFGKGSNIEQLSAIRLNKPFNKADLI